MDPPLRLREDWWVFEDLLRFKGGLVGFRKTLKAKGVLVVFRKNLRFKGILVGFRKKTLLCQEKANINARNAATPRTYMKAVASWANT